MSKTISAYRGSLDGYFQIEASDGSFGEVFPAGNLSDFAITPNASELEVLSTQNADYGQAADTMTDAESTAITFTANRFNVDNMRIANMATLTERTAIEASITGEEVTAVLGGIFKTAGLDISSVVVTDSTSTTTYVLNDDYEIVDAELGLIKVLADGDIADGESLLVNYTKAAETGYLISGGKSPSTYIRFWGRGINRFNNKRTLIKIGRGSVRPDGSFSYVGSDAAEQGFAVTATIPTDGSAPYEIITEA